MAAREMLVDLPLPYGKEGSVTVPNSPLRLSATAHSLGEPMPEHGGDTDDVLGTWLGMAPEDIAGLRAGGVIK